MEDSDHTTALLSMNLEENKVYLVRCLDTGTSQALELYNDSKKGVNIHHTKTMELLYTNTLA